MTNHFTLVDYGFNKYIFQFYGLLKLTFITNLDCIENLITFEFYTMDPNMHINWIIYLILRKLPKPQKFIFKLFGPCNKFNWIKDENNKDNTLGN